MALPFEDRLATKLKGYNPDVGDDSPKELQPTRQHSKQMNVAPDPIGTAGPPHGSIPSLKRELRHRARKVCHRQGRHLALRPSHGLESASGSS
uniref:Uncharacterized protein n=1 Tax=Solanum tuberosum TaxID=4113 RepID=M1DWP2_SOLTU